MWVFFLSFFSEACKYNKGEWLPCNEATNEKTRQLTLKKGDPNICNATMTIVKPCRRRDAFTAAKTSRRLISEFVNLRSRLAWHQNLCSGCFFTHVLYLCADSHLLHVISDYTLFFVEHKIETCVFAYKLLWKIKIAMYENWWLYTKSSRTGDWNCNRTKWNMCQCSGYAPFCMQARSSWSPSHGNHLAVSCFSLGHHADLQWLWFVFGYRVSVQTSWLGGVWRATTPCWLAVVCVWLQSVDTNHLARGSVTYAPTPCWLAVVVCSLRLVTRCQYKPLCSCVYWGGGGGDMCPNIMLIGRGCGCMRFAFGYRVSIQTTWLGGVWHAHQHHDPHPQAQVGRPGTLSTDQTAHTQVPQTLVFCAIFPPCEHTEWLSCCCWCWSAQSEFGCSLWEFTV